MIRNGIILLVISSLLAMVGAYAKIMHRESADIILGISLAGTFVSWGLLFYGLAKRKPREA